MNNDSTPLRNDTLAWARVGAKPEGDDAAVFSGAAWWLTGGASLLLWTGLALLLTSA